VSLMKTTMSGLATAFWCVSHSTFLNASALTAKSSSGFLKWLMHLGGVGLFALAIVDSSMVPVPLPGSTDLVLLLLTAFRSSSLRSPIIFASCALAGSVVGGYMAWAAGKKGGEAALERLGKGRFVQRVQRWVKRNGILSVWLAAIQPPPMPLMPFTLAAGALGLSLPRFMIAYCTGRAVRYALIAWLGYKYGRQVLVWWQRDLKGWTTPILSVYVSLLVMAAGYGLWKYRKEIRADKQHAKA
jgi:membrane protein YqaA with SNARE-associated domain